MQSFVTCTLVVLAVLVPAAVWAQSCHLRELDLCAATGAGSNKISTTDADIDKQCGVLAESKECFSNFTTRCTTPIQRELGALVTQGAAELGTKFCTKGDPLRVEYLKHAPCIAKTQPEGKKCLQDVRVGLEKIEEAKFQERITVACCVYGRYTACTTKAVESQCGKDAVEYGQLLIRLATSNLLDVVCKGYDTNPVCNTHLPPPGTKAKGNSKSILSKLFNAYVS